MMVEGNNTLPVVKILATGGTIAGKGKDPLGTQGYKPGELSVDELIAAVPGIEKVAEIRGEQICNMGSTSLTNEIWLRLAKRINEIFRDEPEVAGVVVTHGTDTLEETAYFLNLVVKSDKPVVVVGSMRPATAISADGPMNLANAVRLASSPDAVGKGVLVMLNDTIHAARDVTKTNTSRLDTFRNYELGALGYVHSGLVTLYHAPLRKHTYLTEFDISALTDLPRVDIVYSYVGSDDVVVKAVVEAGAKGIVHAGCGAGASTPKTGEALRAAADAGVIVGFGSRTGSGRLNPAGGDALKRGIVTTDNLNPQKARVLLMLALTKTSDAQEIQRMFTLY